MHGAYAYLSCCECQCNGVYHNVKACYVAEGRGGGGVSGAGRVCHVTCHVTCGAYVCQRSQNTLPMTLKPAMHRENSSGGSTSTCSGRV